MVRADFVHVQRDVIPMLVADRPWWRKHQQEQHPVHTNHLLPASRHISYCNLHFCKGRKGRFKECLIYINNVLVLFKLCCIWMCHITSPRVRHTVKYRTDTNLGCKTLQRHTLFLTKDISVVIQRLQLLQSGLHYICLLGGGAGAVPMLFHKNLSFRVQQWQPQRSTALYVLKTDAR